MTQEERSRRYYARKSEGRCTEPKCGAWLPLGYAWSRCADCQAKRRPNRTRSRDQIKAEYEADLVRVIACGDMSAKEMAKVTGINIGRVYHLRTEARVRGVGISSDRPERNCQTPGNWEAIDGAKHCDRCGLRGPHECLHGALFYATHRRGPGATYPNRDGVATISMARQREAGRPTRRAS